MPLDERFVAVAEDHNADPGGNRIKVEIGASMDDVQKIAGKFDGLSGRKVGAGRRAIDIAANGGEWSELLQFGEDLGVADVARMNEMVDTAQSGERLGPEQAVCVGKDADGHELTFGVC